MFKSLIAGCPRFVAPAERDLPHARSKHMSRGRPTTLLAGAALMPLTALAVAACGGGGSATAATKEPTSAATKAPKSAAPHAPTVRVAKTHLGKALVDSRGRTLYLFTKDAGMKSACSGACATAWPPLRASGKPTVSGGAKASLVGTTMRSDGKLQVTYNGHPLYSFVKDTKSGDTNGEALTAFGGSWFAVSPAGKRIATPPSRSGGGSSSSRPAAPAEPPAPKKAPQPAAPKSSPAPKKPPSASNGIPQNNGGDQDSDNNGGPDDGDGGI
jgi:predicted lipoprotein with Yx(FWY)xxD motif